MNSKTVLQNGYTHGDERNCRNCQQPLYFGGLHWWHKHNDSGYCFKQIAEDQRQAEPDLDETERVRAAAPELLEALKAIEQHHIEINNRVGRRLEASCTLAIARNAIAKAEGK